ncbi:MAG: hypothetical protein ACI9FN_002780 [Saprospiraceae bacterium]
MHLILQEVRKNPTKRNQLLKVYPTYRFGSKAKCVLLTLYFCITVIDFIALTAQINPCTYGGIQNAYAAGFKLDELPDNVEMSEDNMDNVWMFLGLQSATYEEYRFEKAGNGQYSYHFPQADFVMMNPDASEQYFIKDNEKWYIVGHASLKKGSIEPLFIDYQIPIDGCYPEFGQSRSFYGSPFEIVNSEDAKLRLRMNVKDSRTISGKLYLPEGVYEAYRVEREVTYDYDLSVAEEYASKAYQSYFFLDRVSGELLMEVRLDTDRSIDWIKYKSSAGDVPVRSRVGKNQFALYPSTSFGDNLRLDFLNFGKGNYTLEVYNIMGKRMWSRQYDILGDTTLKENLSFLPKGTYIYALLDGDRNRIATRRLAIIKA